VDLHRHPAWPEGQRRGLGSYPQVGHVGEVRKLAFTDFGCVGPLPDVSDRSLWYKHNPELGGRLLFDTVADEFDDMSDEGFARERLCWWPDDEVKDSLFGAGAWDACKVPDDEDSQIMTRLCYAVAVSIDREWTSIGAAGFRKDGLMHVELVERRRGLRWVPDWFTDEDKPHRSQHPIALDAGGPASSLQGSLEDENRSFAGRCRSTCSTGCAAPTRRSPRCCGR
jgi:hypothetical protein